MTAYLICLYLTNIPTSTSSVPQELLIMAIPYPEGECFFDRKALKAPGGSYDPENLGHFYSNMMVEYIYNEESYHGEKASNFADGGFQHRRSEYNIVRTMIWDTFFGAWAQLPFSYGPTPQTVTRRTQHSLCCHAPVFVARDKGDAAQVSPHA